MKGYKKNFNSRVKIKSEFLTFNSSGDSTLYYIYIYIFKEF